MHTAPIAPGRVLPTLNPDGTRRKIHPKLARGRHYRARLASAWGVIALFVTLPFIKIGGNPLVLLDIPAREFTLGGRTFLATDGVLLMLLLLSVFVGIVWLTALAGRAWCGWSCPQTVYMEFVFRPIERLIEGDRASQLRLDRKGWSSRRLLKHGAFFVLSALIANVFLAYFVGVERLSLWMTRSPFEHPTSFLVMATTASLAYLDFGVFREQMCTVVCPYAKLQSVLLDPRSLIVGYDAARGEPRGKGKPRLGQGDCIDCNACVTTCPTGIDIREGLQLECIACAQCIDACDGIMARIGKPAGLIRYGSQQGLRTGKPTKALRPRVVVYPVILLALLIALLLLGARNASADITVLRGIGAPFTVQASGVSNQVRLKVRNRTSSDRSFRIELLGAADARLIAPENPVRLAAGEQTTTTLFVIVPAESFARGEREVRVRMTDTQGWSFETPYRLLGPTSAGASR
jgi:cytochrome c oxidase accessory protein FixG